MIVVSTAGMFGLRYLNTCEVDHIFFSETRAYMALFMGAVMAVVMTSKRAHITDPRVRKRADGIVEARVREIAEMKALIVQLKDKR